MTKLAQIDNPKISASDFSAPTEEIVKQSYALRSGHWLLIGFAILCLLFMAFITIARSIQISTITADLADPKLRRNQAAQVNFASWLKLPIGNRVLVLPGSHQIEVTASGFVATKQVIQVANDRHQQFEILLEPLPGNLAVTLNPAVSAKVALNDQPFGQLPGILRGIPAGQHSITIDAPLYRAATLTVMIEGRDITTKRQVDLQPAWANVTLASIPVGAEVKIDDVAVGSTPLQLKVEEGTHSITFQAEKFKPFTQDITIVAEQDLTLPEISLVPADGVLKITSKPNQAAVVIDGVYHGNSPISVSVKPNRAHQVQIYKAGYRLQSKEIILAPAQSDRQDISLQQDVVSVRFGIKPSDAELVIDGVRRGRGSQTISLNTLPHKISVRKPGYVSYNDTLIPTKSSSQVVSVGLLTEEQHFWANVPNSYTTDAGQKMKLFKSPGAVKMGSSRRETGRRSNETAYSARLNKDFYVSLHEVTNKQFRTFQPTHNSGNYKRKSLDSAKHPVANVSWQQAALYCNWLSKREGLKPFYTTKAGYISGQHGDANGYRLLTEVEWAWLARNRAGSLLTYAWGESLQPSQSKPIGNFADVNAAEFIKFTLANYDDGYKASAPVGRFESNFNGLFDLEGNVSEWVNDWYSSNAQIAERGTLVDPFGPDEGEFHVIRGASWARGHLPQLRLAYRDFGAKGSHDVGFRIARYVGKP